MSAFPCKVCSANLGWDRPSGVCSEKCLCIAQGFPLPAERLRIAWIAYVRVNGEWSLLWQSEDPVGPHWLALCDYRSADKEVFSVYL